MQIRYLTHGGETQRKADREGIDASGICRMGLDSYLNVIFPDVDDRIHDKAIEEAKGTANSYLFRRTKSLSVAFWHRPSQRRKVESKPSAWRMLSSWSGFCSVCAALVTSFPIMTCSKVSKKPSFPEKRGRLSRQSRREPGQVRVRQPIRNEARERAKSLRQASACVLDCLL